MTGPETEKLDAIVIGAGQAGTGNRAHAHGVSHLSQGGDRNKWYVLAILCTGLFMRLLDGTIVNIAIPSIMTAFETGFSEVEWVMNAYLLVFAVMLITMGRLGDLYGRRRLFASGLVVFLSLIHISEPTRPY